MFRDLGVARHELTEVAENAPGVADAIVRLYRAYPGPAPAGRARRLAAAGGRAGAGRGAHPVGLGARLHPGPAQLLSRARRGGRGPGRDAEARAAGFRRSPPANGWRERHGIQVRVVPAGRAAGLAAPLRPPPQAAVAVGGAGRAGRAPSRSPISSPCWSTARPSPPSPRAPSRRTRRRAACLRVSLANYLAAAMLMPYEAFHDACERSAYDIELIAARFGASFEQACHRLTTLSRPGRARRAVLHAAGGFRRQHLQALRQRGLSRSPASAAPARAGTCTQASRRPAGWSPRSSRPRTARAISPSSRTVRRAAGALCGGGRRSGRSAWAAS